MVVGEGFEPSKAEPADLQSAPFGHSGTQPSVCVSTFELYLLKLLNLTYQLFKVERKFTLLDKLSTN